MSTVQQWGRKESIIWPPHGYVYTLGAFIFAFILTGVFIYLHFEFGLSPLQRYYLPYYLRTEPAGLTHPVSQYQLLFVSDGEKPGRIALDADVEPGSTPQIGGKPLSMVLTSKAANHGTSYLIRENFHNYQNKALHAWIAHWIYADVPIYRLFSMQFIFGFVALLLQLPFSIRKDIRRIKDLRYGRRLKGPVLVNSKQFTRAVAGNGIGITTEDSKLPLRIPRDAENKHFLIVGDTGSGKLPKRRIAPKAKSRFEARVRILTRRTRGISIETMVRELGRYLQGWQGYFGFCQTPTVLDRFNKWIRRRIRSAACKQWRTGKTRYARLRELGLSHDLAARTAGHQWGPWRLSRTEALSYAMPAAYFDRLGLPSLRCTTGA